MREMQAAGALLGHRPSLHSFYESAIITAANAHMALAFGLDAHHPMDCGQPGLAADVVAPGVIQIGGGALHCPAGPGIGITPEPERIAALATAETQIIR
jgi:L-alanine-DL-glutamate epimerase-like enolase superfamily enzyme